MKNARHFVVFAVLIASTIGMHAQMVRVDVRLTQPPPNQLRVADLWKVELFNHEKTNVTIYLHGTAEELSIPDGIIADATTKTFSIPPGRTVVTGNDVQPVKVNQSNNFYRDALLRTGSVPTGDYQICCEAIEVASDQVVGRDCKFVTVNRTSQPILISPVDESEVLERYPVFTWMASVPPSPGQNMLYKLTIVEIFGRQSAADAIQRNPAWLEMQNLNRTIYQYPVSARGFALNQRYAWKISAYEMRGTTVVPLGESEIWWFTFKPLGTGDVAGDGRADVGGGAPKLSTECTGENWDFEIGSLACWTVEGDAFADDPVLDAHDVLGTNGHHGKYWVSSYGYYDADKARGTMVSQEVQLKNNSVGILFGGSNERDACIELLVEKQAKDTFKLQSRTLSGNSKTWWIAHTTAGAAAAGVTDRMNSIEWDVSKYLNRSAVIYVRDSNQAAHLNFDYVRFFDRELRDSIKLPVLVMAAGENHSLVATPQEKPTLKELQRYTSDISNIKGGRASVGSASVVNETSTRVKGQYETTILNLEKVGNFKAMAEDNSNAMPDITAKDVDEGVMASQSILSLAALNPKNIVWGWGDNLRKAVTNSSNFSVKDPTMIPKVKDVRALAAGMDQSFAVEKSGTLKGWGYNDYGQLGMGDRNLRAEPTTVPDISNVVSVATGSRNSYAVTTIGDVYVWGYNRTFEAGVWIPFYVNNTTGQIDSMVMIKKPLKHAALKNCRAVAAGEAHGLALNVNGLIYSWGVNSRGQTGHDDDEEYIVWPTPIRLDKSRYPVVAIAAGADHSLALTRDGKVWSWGGNASGQLGDGTNTDRFTPQHVASLTGVRAISAGEGFSVALDSSGIVWAWGNNVVGQLGDGTRVGKKMPVQVSGLTAVQGVVAGGTHAMAVRADGGLWTWGTNEYGQLGEGPIINPAPVLSDPSIGPIRVERLATAP